MTLNGRLRRTSLGPLQVLVVCIMEDQHTEEDVRTDRVRKHLVVIIGHISKGYDIQLRLATATSCIDGKQDWERYTASDKAGDDTHLE